MEQNYFGQRVNILTRPSSEGQIGWLEHNGAQRLVTHEQMDAGNNEVLTRFNVYTQSGENIAYSLGKFSTTGDEMVFTAEQAKNFEDPFAHPEYRSVLKSLVKYMVNKGVTWRSDELEELSSEKRVPNSNGRNATHMYESLLEESKRPGSSFTCDIIGNRYVLRRKEEVR